MNLVWFSHNFTLMLHSSCLSLFSIRNYKWKLGIVFFVKCIFVIRLAEMVSVLLYIPKINEQIVFFCEKEFLIRINIQSFHGLSRYFSRVDRYSYSYCCCKMTRSFVVECTCLSGGGWYLLNLFVQMEMCIATTYLLLWRYHHSISTPRHCFHILLKFFR